jgi:hypothetical protein
VDLSANSSGANSQNTSAVVQGSSNSGAGANKRQIDGTGHPNKLVSLQI